MSKYEYDVIDDKIYCYENTNILKNKFNIHSSEDLSIIEERLAFINYVELLNNPLVGDFSLSHLQKIHYELFSDVYDWAGEIRKVNITKGVNFCNCIYIDSQFTEIENELIKDNYLCLISSQEEAIKKYSYYLAEINAIHPFREGNGRAQRIYMNYISRLSGFKLDFSKSSKDEMIKACYESMYCKYEKMEELISKCISRIPEESTHHYKKLFSVYIGE